MLMYSALSLLLCLLLGILTIFQISLTSRAHGNAQLHKSGVWKPTQNAERSDFLSPDLLASLNQITSNAQGSSVNSISAVKEGCSGACHASKTRAKGTMNFQVSVPLIIQLQQEPMNTSEKRLREEAQFKLTRTVRFFLNKFPYFKNKSNAWET